MDNNYNSILWGNGSKARDSVITTASNIIISANDKNGCYTKDTILVDFKYYPIADFGSDTTLCNNETLTLQLYPQSNPFFSGSYIWQDSSRNDKFTVTVPGIYTGSSSYDGCTASDTIKVSYVNAQNAELGNDTTICEGDSLLLKVNIGNANFLWNTGDTTSYIFVKTAGQYTVHVSNALCAQSDTINISVFN